jgi:AraC-like DNA-binding protein
MAWVRSAGLRGVRDVVGQLGGDADKFVRRAGLPDGALDNDELLVRDSAIAALLELAAHELDCADLGLRVALRQDLGMLGPLAVALQNSPTAADALDCTSRYLFIHARSLSVTLIPDPVGTRGVLGVRYGYPEPVRIPRQSADMGLLFLHRVLQRLLGERYGLRSVEVPHLPLAPLSRYEELFGVRVNVDRPAAVLRVPSDILGRTMDGGDDMTRRLALAYLNTQTPTASRAVVGRVRAILQQSLGTGSVSVKSVAELLSMSPRTLQRHLTDEGTPFSAILDGVRRERADTLLRTSDLPLAQISAAIGFHDATTLSQSARRWWGSTARERRSEARSSK